jgi:thiamine-phosphate pyrophosphorylase
MPAQLYLISPPALDDVAGFAADLDRVCATGLVSAFQLRLKGADDPAVLAAAAVLVPLVQGHGVAALLNDRPDLAARCGADGVHVGQEDAPLREARRTLGPEATIGVTVHASRHLAMEAAEAGADYVAFGAFFDTATKTPPARAHPSILSWWQQVMEVPCVAIGGITVDTAGALVRAGADFLAVSAGVWQYPDGPVVAVERLAQACTAPFEPENEPAGEPGGEPEGETGGET